ncbi:unnamed protein product [Heterobilharzia americana]|nr:unnamed protein product [Heterobilharzia americana]
MKNKGNMLVFRNELLCSWTMNKINYSVNENPTKFAKFSKTKRSRKLKDLPVSDTVKSTADHVSLHSPTEDMHQSVVSSFQPVLPNTVLNALGSKSDSFCAHLTSVSNGCNNNSEQQNPIGQMNNICNIESAHHVIHQQLQPLNSPWMGCDDPDGDHHMTPSSFSHDQYSINYDRNGGRGDASSENMDSLSPEIDLLGEVDSDCINKKCLVLDLDETLVHSSFKVKKLCIKDGDYGLFSVTYVFIFIKTRKTIFFSTKNSLEKVQKTSKL